MGCHVCIGIIGGITCGCGCHAGSGLSNGCIATTRLLKGAGKKKLLFAVEFNCLQEVVNSTRSLLLSSKGHTSSVFYCGLHRE